MTMYSGRRFRRSVPEINSSSTADIAFLLLIFFLMTTSMDTDTGLARRLPEWVAEGRKPETVEVRERNVLSVRLDADDRLWCDERPVGLAELHAVAREFVENPDDREDLPERVATEVPGLGTVEVMKRHVILLSCHRGATYKAYVAVQDELAGVYQELRNELSRRCWGQDYADLPSARQQAVRLVYPQRVSEETYGGEGGRP